MNNSKSLLFGGVILLFVIVSLVPLTSAELSFSNFQQLFWENVSNLTITIHQNDAQANLSLNTANAPFDQQIISGVNINNWANGFNDACKFVPNTNCSNVQIAYNVSDLLNGVNWTSQIPTGSNKIQLSDTQFSTGNIFLRGFSGGVSFNATIPYMNLTNYIFNNLSISFNSNSINSTTGNCSGTCLDPINNYLTAHSLNFTSLIGTVSSDRNIFFNKTGNSYTLWSNKGYGDLSDSTKNSITSQDSRSMILQKIVDNMTSVLKDNLNIINTIFPGIDLSSYTISTTNLSNIHLEDGGYIINLSISNATNTYYKNIYLTLDGIKNTDTSTVNSTGIYIPTSTGIQDYLDNIGGLTNNTNVIISSFDKGGYSSTPSGTIVKYLDISINQPLSGIATINFKIPNYKNIHPKRIVLYHFDGTNWNKLPTSDNGVDSKGNYLFYATTTSFSPFAIVELPAPVVSGTGGSAYGGHNLALPVTTPTNPTPAPINATPAPTAPGRGFFATITGAVIGALGSPVGIAVVFAIIIVGALVIVFRVNKNPKAKKKSKEKEEKEGEEEEE